jgi:plastocyanin
MAKLRMYPTVLGSAAVRCGAVLAAIGAAAQCGAATLEVSVVDERGRPIENVAIYATGAQAVGEHGATGAALAAVADERTAVMDQQGLRFAPHVLVVQSGTEVAFPNSDTVSHHVYSFSEAKTFELPLYKGDVYEPVVFDRPGIVVVGCNIHDGMLGYVVVVDTPHFAVTNEHGVALVDGLPPGEYTIAAWTPRVRPAGLPPGLPVVVAGTAAAEIRIAGRLAPAHEHGTSSLTWERY